MSAWRFIDTGPCTAPLNMAIDEAIAQSVREGKVPPTLRVYAWIRPSVTIGCFQKMSSLNLPYCSEMNISVIRRITGGRAILHNHELTYGFSAPTLNGPFSKGLRDSYKKISHAFCLALSTIGLSPEAGTAKDRCRRGDRNPLCFDSLSFAEITLRSRKVVGSAQKRWRDGLLQQGSVPYSFDEEMVKKIFIIDPAADLRERMIGLTEVVPDLNPERFKEAVRLSFEEAFQISLIRSPLSWEERLFAQELETRRYLSRHWNFQR